MARKRFGILTAGGDCPGLNATLRSLVKTAHETFDMEAIGFRHGFKGILEKDYVRLSPDKVSGILTVGGTILGTSREKVFKNKPGDERDKPALIRQVYDELDLDCLVVLGGNGTQKKAYHLQEAVGLNVLGLPKTIDNDIVGTEACFGFSSAVSIATEAIDRIHTTAHSHNRIMVVELMGHHAGWLALYSGIAGGGDVILIPEIPYNIEAVAAAIKKRSRQGKGFSIVVVAEGALSEAEAAMKKKARKAFLAGKPSAGYRVAKAIEAATGLESRITVLGYVQRGGPPNAWDRVLSTRMGAYACQMLAREEYGRMVAQIDDHITSVDLAQVAGKVRQVPADHRLLSAGRYIGTSFGGRLD